MAGTRIRKVYIPNKYVVTAPSRTDDSLPWKQWQSFFSNNPEAGQQAEEAFVKLFKGQDDEYLTEQEATTTTTKQESKTKYVEEKDTTKSKARSS